MIELLPALGLGLLSSAHCIGMCGGFAAAIGAAQRTFKANLARQLAHSSGRLTTYAFLGAVGGQAGLVLSRFNSTLVTAQQIFSALAGVMMLVIGASVLGVLRPRVFASFGVSSLFAPLFRHFLSARDRRGFFAAGVANGFLPCGLVYAFLAQAVASEDMTSGALLMIAFGLGTVPAMVAMGCGSALVGHVVRVRIHRFAALLVMVAGIATVVRAVPFTKTSTHCSDMAHQFVGAGEEARR